MVRPSPDPERRASLHSDARLAALVAAAGVATWSWDVSSDHVTSSEGIEKLFGVAPGGFARNYPEFLALVHPADHAILMSAIGGVMEGRADSYALEHRVVWPDGSVHWLSCKGLGERDESGRVVRLEGIVFDITPTKRTQDALLESEDLVRSAMEHSPIGMAVVSPAGRFLDVNPALTAILGYSREELLSGDFQGITHPDDLARDVGLMTETLAGRRTTYQMEKRYVRKDGTTVWAQLNVSLVRNPDDSPRYFVSQVQDISERRRIEEQLRHAQKMDAFGQLAGGVAHDFNNLLAVILPHAQLSARAPGLDPAVRDSLAEIEEASKQAARLTRQLLQLSRRDILRPRVVDLGQAVARFAGVLRRLLREDVSLTVRLAPEPTRVVVDPSLFDQVMMNLAVNARDAMPEGGTLTIETSTSTLEAPIDEAFATLAPGRYVRVTVTDTGQGVRDEHLPRLFEPFFTTKPPGKGTGLGLATVRGIVQQHGGAITVSSALGVGTTFTLLLPGGEHAEVAEDEAPITDPQRGGTETILVVEDDPAVRGTTALTLRRNGYRVVTATEGLEALRVLDERPEIALVITDLVMPGRGGGRSLLEALAARRPRPKVIVTSGYSPEVFGRELELREGVNFAAKPVGVSTLLDMVRRTLDAE